jgi:glucosamine 6-phosphate synthetase-like amidotransferase/phosphosugar isomerase protein
MDDRRDINVMIEEINMTPEIILDNIRIFSDIIDERKEIFEGKNISKVYSVGCGDSYYAGMSVKYAFIKNSSINFESCEALEFCRYEVDYMPENSLVFVISSSGSVARTIEAALIAKKRGATVVAITGNSKSRLAQIADNVIAYKINSLGFAPGTISFTAAQLMLIVCSVKLGLYCGKLIKADEKAIYDKLAYLADIIRKTIKYNNETVKNAALRLKDRKKFYIIGAGPNYPIAMFAAAKFIEGGEMDGIYQELEEWAHEQYFISSAETDTIVIAPDGRSISRAEELIKEMNFIQTGNILITTKLPDKKKIAAKDTFEIPYEIEEEYSPLVTSVLISMFSYYISFANNKSSYNFKSDEQEKEHYETLHNSKFSEELRGFM